MERAAAQIGPVDIARISRTKKWIDLANVDDWKPINVDELSAADSDTFEELAATGIVEFLLSIRHADRFSSWRVCGHSLTELEPIRNEILPVCGIRLTDAVALFWQMLSENELRIAAVKYAWNQPRPKRYCREVTTPVRFRELLSEIEIRANDAE